MTQTKKRAIFTFIIWGAVMITFSILFFAGGGPEAFARDTGRHVAGAIIIALGYLFNVLMLILTAPRPKGPAVSTDERDVDNKRRANSAAFIVVLVYVFALAIFLWERYQAGGSVPVGWMWFLAYSMSFVAWISSAVISLIIEAKTVGHGQG